MKVQPLGIHSSHGAVEIAETKPRKQLHSKGNRIPPVNLFPSIEIGLKSVRLRIKGSAELGSAVKALYSCLAYLPLATSHQSTAVERISVKEMNLKVPTVQVWWDNDLLLWESSELAMQPRMRHLLQCQTELDRRPRCALLP